MDKYIEAEKELAEVLRFHQITVGHFSNETLSACPYGEFQRKEYLPRWARDDAAAFQLMVDQSCYPYSDEQFAPGEVLCSHEVSSYPCVAVIKDHPDKASAVRFAIVQAVISKLKMSSAERQ